MDYEFLLRKEDVDLKDRELDKAKEILQRDDRPRPKRYLDIGTCTARYPLGLLDAVPPECVTLGIDNDHDSVRFAKWKTGRQASAQPDRIEIRELDFRNKRALRNEAPFDLITCMLGTISHFGRSRKTASPFQDALQEALQRMHDLTSDSGRIMIGAWSSLAIREKRFLGIYSEVDQASLAAWSPHPAELAKRLDELGLDVERVAVDDRLVLFHCRKRPTNA